MINTSPRGLVGLSADDIRLILHSFDVVEEIEGTSRAFEYGKYTDDILDKIHIALKVPRTMFTAPEQARPVFEPYVKYLQKAVESAINSQLMPQFGDDVKFVFRHLNVDDAFTKAKTDMIYLSEGVLAPSEVRKERGLDAEGIVEKQPTAAEVNISGGKNQDKQEESQRTEQRLSRNQTGKRTEEEVVEVVA